MRKNKVSRTIGHAHEGLRDNLRPCLILFLTLFYFIDLKAAAIIESDWQCVVLDQTQKKWVGFASFKRTAKQKAMDTCKKESIYPKTCMHVGSCFSSNNSLAKSGLWVCTALDRNGDPWISNGASDKWSAALAAKGYCKSKSTIPHTCYVNTVTCRKRGI